MYEASPPIIDPALFLCYTLFYHTAMMRWSSVGSMILINILHYIGRQQHEEGETQLGVR